MRRLMAFVDGTNLLTEMGKKIGVSELAYSPTDEVIQLGTMVVNGLLRRLCVESIDKHLIVRKYWFGSCQGSQETATHYKTLLRKHEFEPMIYKRNKNGREKKVDIAVAKEMLINAFHHNCDLSLLVAGDADYVDLTQDLKRYGVNVIGAFFEEGRSPELELACDVFCNIEIWGDNHKELEEKIRTQYPPLNKKNES